MATSVFANITQKGISAAFTHAMSTVPQVWDKHCMQVPSTSKVQTYAWPGFLPKPREFINMRETQGIIDFTYDVTDKVYELTFAIDRVSQEDDQESQIQMRIAEAAQTWATYKDELFAFLVYEGDGTTAVGPAFDALAFHADTRTIGASANIDNLVADSNPSSATAPTATEFLFSMRLALNQIWRFQDDKGRPMTTLAMQNIRCIIPPEYHRAAVEAFNSTIISNSDNPWGRGLAEFDVLPYLQASGTDDSFWVNAIGAPRMPFIYQERTPLEIIVDSDAAHVAKEDKLNVYVRQRFIFAYGEPRYSVRLNLT